MAAVINELCYRDTGSDLLHQTKIIRLYPSVMELAVDGQLAMAFDQRGPTTPATVVQQHEWPAIL